MSHVRSDRRPRTPSDRRPRTPSDSRPRTPNAPSPTVSEVISLATSMGYRERRPSVSSTLFFAEGQKPDTGHPPCLINIYYTTRSIMTYIDHPNSGTGELWRSNAYDNLEELREIFANPRMHTGKGYRNKNKAVRGCVSCGGMKRRTEFSGNQWNKGPDTNRCKSCVEEDLRRRSSADPVHDDADAEDEEGSEENDASGIIQNLSDLHLGSDSDDDSDDDSDSDFPTLTSTALTRHDRATSKQIVDRTERRQFNCPECPRRGRGTHVFFKKVPVHKPVVKCPKCKAVSRGNCKRLYAVPKGSEKGYGLYKCKKCRDFWGSSRAVGNVGQSCFRCSERGAETMVPPFRIEVYRRKKKGNGGGNNGQRRVPREPIGENEADERSYGDADRRRNEVAVGTGDGRRTPGDGSDSSHGVVSLPGSDRSYDFVDRPGWGSDTSSSGVSIVRPLSRVPSGYVHKCAACGTGACKSRKVPKSEIRDDGDGNTVSTRGSIVTNSSIDKSDFIDRDEDFSGFDNED